MRRSFRVISAALLVLLAGFDRPCSAEGFRREFHDFTKTDGAPAAWTTWAPREEIKPQCFVDSVTYRSAPNSLAISGNSNSAEYGGWVLPIENIKAGQYYQLTAYYRTRGVRYEQRQVVARLDWTDDAGKRKGQPDYAYETSREGEWTRVTMLVPAPDEATRVKVELSLGWAPQGTVWWDDLSFTEAPPPPPRPVRIGTVVLHPTDPSNKEANIENALKRLDEIGPDKPDIVCLGEGIPALGNSVTYVSVAEPIPGPITDQLGEKARKYGMYIVAGLYEREGATVYNTAVLIDRQGHVVGKYRKNYLPREEIEEGLTPGSDYPVFTTDFGKIGIMICWDSQYVDPARALAAQGAEIIFVPAAAVHPLLAQARAIENCVYVVTSVDQGMTSVINPAGETVYTTRDPSAYKTTTIDLQKRFVSRWLGDMKPRFFKEMRRDIPVSGLTN